MEDRIRRLINGALDDIYEPAPWLLATSVASVKRARKGEGRLPWVAAAIAVIVTFSSVGLLTSLRASHTTAPSIRTALPQPTPQPLVRTSPGAQIAWITIVVGSRNRALIGIDGKGHVVARLDSSNNAQLVQIDVFWRSADGSTLYGLGSGQIFAYSAANGSLLRTYTRPSGNVVGNAVSRDGRWLAILVFDTSLKLQVLDLSSGQWQVQRLAHDPNAALPGMNCSPSPGCLTDVVWGLVVFSRDSTHLYTLTDWGGPSRVSAFALNNGLVIAAGSAVSGEDGRTFTSCAGPAMAAEVGADGQTLIAFCHFDGSTWFFDLRTLRNSGVVPSSQSNPFWLSPIFTPDGQLLYLQSPEPGSSMQVIDLMTHRRLGPVSLPISVEQPGPLAWLFAPALAGRVASTMPVSPDGRSLYAATEDGVVVMRIPDLKPLRKLWPAFKANEVWISGDGTSIYSSSDDGSQLAVIHSDGSGARIVKIPNITGFVATEHA